jgi:integrase
MSLNLLKDITIKQAKATEKDYTLNDGGGLILYIKTSGSKQWIFRYTYNGKRKKTTFGNYPLTTLENARTKRNTYLDLIANDIDPIESNKQIKEQEKAEKEKQANPKTTIKFLFDAYLDMKQHNQSLKDITINKTKKRLEQHIYEYLPLKGGTQINDISFDMFVDILKRIENVNKLETLERVRTSIIQILKYAYAENILENAEIFAKIEVKTFKRVSAKDVRNMPTLTKPQEIKNLIIGINDYQGEIYTKYALLFSIHTAQRQGSIITAEWSDIDFENAMWNIPAEKMKMQIEHNLPLSKQLVKMLKELKQFTGESKYVFPNTQYKSRHMSENTVNVALRRLGYTKDEIVAHGFRAMFSTVCNEHLTTHNLPFTTIEKALAHKEKDVIKATYDRSKNLEDLKILMQWWSDYLDEVAR